MARLRPGSADRQRHLTVPAEPAGGEVRRTGDGVAPSRESHPANQREDRRRAPAARCRGLRPRGRSRGRARGARLHRVAAFDAPVGRAARGRRAHRLRPPAAGSRHALAGHVRHALGRLVRRGRPQLHHAAGPLRAGLRDGAVDGRLAVPAAGRATPRRGRRAGAGEPRRAHRAPRPPPSSVRAARGQGVPRHQQRHQEARAGRGRVRPDAAALGVLAAAGLAADQGRHREGHRAAAAAALARGPRRRAEQRGLDPRARHESPSATRSGSRTATTSPPSTTTSR